MPKRFSWISPLVIFVLIITFFLIFADIMKLKIPTQWDKDVVMLTGEWDLLVGSELRYQNFELPNVLSDRDLVGQEITLRCRVPTDIERAYSLMFRTSQKRVKVSINGQEIYHYDANYANRRIKLSGLINHFIWLPEQSKGAQLEITLLSDEGRYAGKLYEVSIGSRTSGIGWVLSYDWISVALAFMIFLIALFALTMILPMVKERSIRVTIFYFVLLELSAAFWIGSNSLATQLFIPNQLLLLLFGVTAMHLAPFLLIRYLNSVAKIPYGKVMKKISLLFPIAYILVSLAMYFDKMTYLTTLAPTAFLLVVYTSVLFGLTILAKRRGEKSITFFIIALGFLLLAILGELLLLLLPFETFTNAMVLNFGILCFSIAALIHLLILVFRYIHALGKSDYLYQLAHMDALTATGNRLAFDKDLADIQKGELQELGVAVFMFDVNNLKETNDLLGHPAGDQLLVNVASNLRELVGEDGKLYRIGGDEFTALVYPCSEETFQELQQQINLWVMENLDSNGIAQIAWGGEFSQQQHCDLAQLVAKADSAMYRQKEGQKQKRLRSKI